MTAPDRTSERVIEEAQKLLGVGENPPGSNCNWIIHRWGLCTQWCDATVFTAWFNAGFQQDGAFHMDGVSTDYKPGDLYVPNTMRHFQAAGRFSSKPVPGAAGVHFWGGGEGNSHITVYIKDYGDGTHLNIEGNHNNVCEYVRRRNDDPTIKGYCIPAYVTSPQPAPSTPQFTEELMPTVRIPQPDDRSAKDGKGRPCEEGTISLPPGTKGVVVVTGDQFLTPAAGARVSIGSGRPDGPLKGKYRVFELSVANFPAQWDYDTAKGDEEAVLDNFGPGPLTLAAYPHA